MALMDSVLALLVPQPLEAVTDNVPVRKVLWKFAVIPAVPCPEATVAPADEKDQL